MTAVEVLRKLSMIASEEHYFLTFVKLISKLMPLFAEFSPNTVTIFNT